MNPSYDHVDDENPSVSTLLYMLKDTDGKHVSAHNRLRVDVTEQEKIVMALDVRMAEMDKAIADHTTQLTAVGKRTTDISALRFTPSTVAAIIALCASIIGGSYASTWGLRDEQSAMRTEIVSIKTMIAAQGELTKADTKLQDERAANMADAIKEIKARGEMTDLKVNNLRESVLTNQRR